MTNIAADTKMLLAHSYLLNQLFIQSSIRDFFQFPITRIACTSTCVVLVSRLAYYNTPSNSQSDKAQLPRHPYLSIHAADTIQQINSTLPVCALNPRLTYHRYTPAQIHAAQINAALIFAAQIDIVCQINAAQIDAAHIHKDLLNSYGITDHQKEIITRKYIGIIDYLFTSSRQHVIRVLTICLLHFTLPRQDYLHNILHNQTVSRSGIMYINPLHVSSTLFRCHHVTNAIIHLTDDILTSAFLYILCKFL